MWGFLDYLDDNKFYKLSDHLVTRILTAFDRNPFHVLGISEDSSLEEAKKAWRSLALKFHPDRNPDPDSEEKMKEINDAWEKLKENMESFRREIPKKEDYNLDQDNINPLLQNYIFKLFNEIFESKIYKGLLNIDFSGIFGQNKELKNFYRYQTGKIRVSKDNLQNTFPNVFKLRHKISIVLQNIESQDITPDFWQKGAQNIINIISEGYYYQKTPLMINRDILEYLYKV